MKKNKKEKSLEQYIAHWSWGAFGFRWIWGLFVGVYWPLYYKIGYIISLIIVLPLFLVDGDPTTVFFIVAGAFTTIDLAVSIYLGIVGRRQAWRSRRKKWRDLAHFSKVEKRWQWAFFIALVILLLSVFFTIAQFMMDFVESGTLPSDIRTLPREIL